MKTSHCSRNRNENVSTFVLFSFVLCIWILFPWSKWNFKKKKTNNNRSMKVTHAFYLKIKTQNYSILHTALHRLMCFSFLVAKTEHTTFCMSQTDLSRAEEEKKKESTHRTVESHSDDFSCVRHRCETHKYTTTSLARTHTHACTHSMAQPYSRNSRTSIVAIAYTRRQVRESFSHRALI